MDKKKVTSFAFVGILLASVVSAVAIHDMQDTQISNNYISETMIHAYEKAVSLQVDSDIQAIDITNNVEYTMLGC